MLEKPAGLGKPESHAYGNIKARLAPSPVSERAHTLHKHSTTKNTVYTHTQKSFLCFFPFNRTARVSLSESNGGGLRKYMSTFIQVTTSLYSGSGCGSGVGLRVHGRGGLQRNIHSGR